MLTEIYFDNFKSLKEVLIRPKELGFFCGPNAAGKSNLADAIDFLSQTFRNGISYAVAAKGGFYNMCFRKMRRARGAITCRVKGETIVGKGHKIEFEASFEIRAKGEAIRADFEVTQERYFAQFSAREPSNYSYSLEIERTGNGYGSKLRTTGKPLESRVFRPPSELVELFDAIRPEPDNLLVSSWLPNIFALRTIQRQLSGVRVFQISPRIAREEGTPSVSGELGRHGENLASAIDYIFTNSPRTFEKLQVWLRDVVPEIAALEVGYTESRKIGLYLTEKGFRGPWIADEMSDGTIMSIALFLALLDRRHTTVMIEEPENSLHPWMLRKFLGHAREVSKEKQILVTTHSPLVVAASRPEELYLIERKKGRTQVIPAIEREPILTEMLQKQLMDLGEFWLSGGIGAIPDAPDVDQGDLFK
jgi:predicted ATPase